MKENYLSQQLSWLLNNAHFCYDEESPTIGTMRINNISYSIKTNMKIPKELTRYYQKRGST